MSKTDHQPINENLWNVLDKLRGAEFRGPEELATFLKTEHVRLSSDDLNAIGRFLATRFGRSGGVFYVPEWLAGVFAALTEGVSPKTICDPWAGIGFLIGLLLEASNPRETLAFTPIQGEFTLGKMLVPGANWHVGDPLRLLEAVKTDLDVVASILPMGVGPLLH